MINPTYDVERIDIVVEAISHVYIHGSDDVMKIIKWQSYSHIIPILLSYSDET